MTKLNKEIAVGGLSIINLNDIRYNSSQFHNIFWQCGP